VKKGVFYFAPSIFFRKTLINSSKEKTQIKVRMLKRKCCDL